MGQCQDGGVVLNRNVLDLCDAALCGDIERQFLGPWSAGLHADPHAKITKHATQAVPLYLCGDSCAFFTARFRQYVLATQRKGDDMFVIERVRLRAAVDAIAGR